jgi:hypothetical protein
MSNTPEARVQYLQQTMEAGNVGKKLEGVDLSGCSINGVKFDNLSLKGANFQGASIQDSTFIKSDLSTACFDECTFCQGSPVSFRESILFKATFRKANIHSEVSFKESELHSANLTFEAGELPGTFQNAKYNRYIKWPQGFKPQSGYGLIYDDSKDDISLLIYYCAQLLQSGMSNYLSQLLQWSIGHKKQSAIIVGILFLVIGSIWAYGNQVNPLEDELENLSELRDDLLPKRNKITLAIESSTGFIKDTKNRLIEHKKKNQSTNDSTFYKDAYTQRLLKSIQSSYSSIATLSQGLIAVEDALQEAEILSYQITVKQLVGNSKDNQELIGKINTAISTNNTSQTINTTQNNNLIPLDSIYQTIFK